MGSDADPPAAVVHLRGHGAVPARLEVVRDSLARWLARVVAHAVGWLTTSAATLVITFDPFVASFPFVIGAGLLYRTVRGRYRVLGFRGACPRCGGELALERGSRIRLPWPMTCYACHHEPEIRLVS